MMGLSTFVVYAIAALAEIAGCFAIWAWWRLGASAAWLIPGAASLIAFGWVLAQTDAAFAGRAFAAYGGVYIISSVLWMWLAEGAAARPVGSSGRSGLPCGYDPHSAGPPGAIS